MVRKRKDPNICGHGHDLKIYGKRFATDNQLYCTECRRKANKKWMQRKYLLDPAWQIRKHLKQDWNMTIEDKQQMVDKQEGRCAICNSEELIGKNCAIDHDHKTGKIRGILCQKCNQGLGLFLDNEEILQNAINYLRKSRV